MRKRGKENGKLRKIIRKRECVGGDGVDFGILQGIVSFFPEATRHFRVNSFGFEIIFLFSGDGGDCRKFNCWQMGKYLMDW